MELPLLFLFLLSLALSAIADLYVTSPSQGSVFSAGQQVTVEWLDNGETPSLADIGTVTVGLYHGRQELVQSIRAINVAESHSLTFEPIAEAGPNSDEYYISFISTTLEEEGIYHEAFSPFFTLKNMRGSFQSPLESATTSVSIPPSLLSSTPTELSTITVGTLSSVLPSITSLTPTNTPPSTQSSSAIPTSTSASAASTSDSPNSASSFHTSPLLAYSVTSLSCTLLIMLLL